MKAEYYPYKTTLSRITMVLKVVGWFMSLYFMGLGSTLALAFILIASRMEQRMYER